MTRGYARACGGQRVAEGAPQGHWKILTFHSALSLRGLLATMTIEEATDGDIFLAYVEHVLCPKLQAGDVVVMDNLSAHKVSAGVDPSRGSRTAVPAALFSRPESHRTGLGQTETGLTHAQGQNCRGVGTGAYPGSPVHHPGQRASLVPPLRSRLYTLSENVLDGGISTLEHRRCCRAGVPKNHYLSPHNYGHRQKNTRPLQTCE